MFTDSDDNNDEGFKMSYLVLRDDYDAIGAIEAAMTADFQKVLPTKELETHDEKDALDSINEGNYKFTICKIIFVP